MLTGPAERGQRLARGVPPWRGWRERGQHAASAALRDASDEMAQAWADLVWCKSRTDGRQTTHPIFSHNPIGPLIAVLY